MTVYVALLRAVNVGGTGEREVYVHYPDSSGRSKLKLPAELGPVTARNMNTVRRISGTTRPSKANTEAFDRAVEEIAHVTRHLLDDLVAVTPPKDRAVGAEKAEARSAKRFSAA